MKAPRKTTTKSLERQIIMEAASRCPWCESGKKLFASEVEIHHIDGDPSNTVFENLILTCRNHHGQIESGLIPEWEVKLKKTCLSNPQTLERLGLKPIQTPVKSVNRRRSKAIVRGDNSGVAAEFIQNSGVMAGTIKMEKPPKGPILVAGSLATSADHYGYVEYLIKRLSHYRAWRPKGRTPADNPGVVRKIFERELGRLPKDLPLSRFEDAVAYLQSKIKNTILGRIGKAGISSFEEWKLKGTYPH
jgi:hypothetical protein